MRVIGGRFRSRLLTAPKGAGTRPTSDRLRETLFNVLAPRIENAWFVDLYAGTGAVGIEAVSRGAARVWLAEKSEPALKAIRTNLKTLGIAAEVEVEARGSAALLERMAKALMSQGLKPPASSVPFMPGLKSRPISEANAGVRLSAGLARPISEANAGVRLSAGLARPISEANASVGEGIVDIVFLDPPWEAEQEYARTMEFLGGERGRAVLAEGAIVIAEHSAKKRLAERYGALVRTRELKQGDAGLSFYAITS